MSPTRILIVHPDPTALAALAAMLRAPEFAISGASSHRTAVRLLEQGAPPRLVLLGVEGDEPEALGRLSDIRRDHPRLPVVLLTALPPGRYGEAFHQGAVAVLKFPPPGHLLRVVVAQALRGGPVRPLKEAVEHCEQASIAEALEFFGGNRSEAARALDIDRTTLYLKMRRYGLIGDRSRR